MDEKKINLLKEITPTIKEKGIEIYKRYFELLFENNKELKKLYNEESIKNGESVQKIYEVMIFAFENIDNIQLVMPSVERVAMVHHNKGVKKEYYEIIRTNMLSAIKDVLSDDIDNDTISAISDAYDFLAKLIVRVERRLYKNKNQ